VESLNEQLSLLCKEAIWQNVTTPFPRNDGVLLHGYEGTGKTMLLSELAATFGPSRTMRIEQYQLMNTATKNDETIKSVFQKALSCQPSLIIIDNVDTIAAAGDAIQRPTIRSLEAAFDSISGTRVLVVGATRSPSAIDNALMGPKRFGQDYELPVPDAAARIQIVGLLLGDTLGDQICANLGSRTHGFTGKDLSLLCNAAVHSALGRYIRGKMAKVVAKPSISGDTLVDGSSETNPSPTTTDTAVSVDQPQTVDAPHVILADFDVALTRVRPTALREIILETPKVTWTDIGGSAKIKADFDRIIGWPLQHVEKLARFGNVNWQKSVLLYGPPGCSKTMTAQAVANAYGLNFLVVKGAELISMYVGESERAVREIFRKAKAAAPSIIFFDEIDAIGSDRDSSGSSGLHVLTTLLNEMDGFEALKGVQVIAATNKPASLDPALMRPGRFDKHVYLGPPELAARRDIIGKRLRALQLEPDLAIEGVAVATEGYSGAEVVGICDAVIESIMERIINGQDETVMKADLNAAIAQAAKGITKGMLEGYQAFQMRGQ
jgi:AAA family ATPase